MEITGEQRTKEIVVGLLQMVHRDAIKAQLQLVSRTMIEFEDESADVISCYFLGWDQWY